MAHRIPFPFRDWHETEKHDARFNEMVESWIHEYESALLVEYKSGDMDVASFHEGLRSAYEAALRDVLGVDQELLNSYWLDGDQQRHPQPYADELPLLSDPDNWLITYEQVEEWSGKRLNHAQWDALNDAIPNSSIPEAIGTIVDNLKEN